MRADCPSLSQAKDWLDKGWISLYQHTTVAVGWSGGIDSTALLLALRTLGLQIQAWHIDHAWHVDSASDAQRLAELAAHWGVCFKSIRLESAAQSNREAHAREGRYVAFQRLSEQTGIQTLMLAHHADDQAETVCMRMLQGAGVMGCRGIGRDIHRHGLHICRPLLHIRRDNLKHALQDKGVSWLHDSSNDDVALWRNRIRKQLFPRMQEAGIEPYDLFRRWQQQADNLALKIAKGLNGMMIEHEKHGCSLSWDSWYVLSQSLRVEMLQRMAVMVLGEGKVLGRRHLELIDVWRGKVMQGGGRGGLDLSGCHLACVAGRLHLQTSRAISRT